VEVADAAEFDASAQLPDCCQRLVEVDGDQAGEAGRVLGDTAFDFRPQTAEGVIDVTGRRYMLDYRHYARLSADGQEWDGRSGRAIATLPPNREAVPTPLWLLDLLAGLTEAIDLDTEDVRGAPCRRLATKADLSRAPLTTQISAESASTPDQGAEQRTETLELWDFRVRLDDLDWTRLPTFRSLDEAGR
jgi:hypothetical protein